MVLCWYELSQGEILVSTSSTVNRYTISKKKYKNECNEMKESFWKLIFKKQGGTFT